jgi:ketosteroid isomerase-like protein
MLYRESEVLMQGDVDSAGVYYLSVEEFEARSPTAAAATAVASAAGGFPMSRHSRAEVEEAWREFVAVGDRGDWNAWADLHSEDGIWVEHHLGTMRGREAIRELILKVMKPVPMMRFPVAWHVIDGSRVVFYPWQVLPDPKGEGADYRFGCVTILEYAGDGLWSYQEDLYNPREGEQVVKRWLAAGGKLAT